MTAPTQTTGSLRSRVVLALLVVVFGIQAGVFSFAGLFLVCGIGRCLADGQLNRDSFTGLVIALAAAAILGAPFLIPPWARKKTRVITAAVVAGALFLTLATIIVFPQSTIGT